MQFSKQTCLDKLLLPEATSLVVYICFVDYRSRSFSRDMKFQCHYMVKLLSAPNILIVCLVASNDGRYVTINSLVRGCMYRKIT